MKGVRFDMIRPYDKGDKPQLLAILVLNTPTYFDAKEKEDFEKYLSVHGDTYFVFEDNGMVVGGGGYHFNATRNEGHVSWNLVSPRFKGRGIGRKLVGYCLGKLRTNPEVRTIFVLTSQHAYKFYEKFGFKIKNIKKDSWGEGLDLYEMEMK